MDLSGTKVRFKNYTLLKAGKDIARQGTNLYGAATLGAAVAVGAAASVGAVLTGPAMPVLAGYAKIFGIGVGLLKTGDMLAEQALPRLHQKMASKL